MNWVAFGSLGTFLTFVFTLITIFRKDKHKQAQIDKLAGIASVLEAQNETMRQQNDLISQQVDIFRNTSILKGDDTSALNALREIEEKKLKLSVKPNLRANVGYHGFSGEMQVYLYNDGEDASVLNIQLISTEIILYSSQTPIELKKGRQLEIRGRQAGNKHIKDCAIEIDVTYSDKLSNQYVSTIKGTGSGIKIVQTREIE